MTCDDRMTSAIYGVLLGNANNANAATSTGGTKSLTLADIERMVALIEKLPPEPIGEWMRDQGYPPKLWRVVLPAKVCENHRQLLWPHYVSFSDLIEAPVFVRHAFLDIQPLPPL